MAIVDQEVIIFRSRRRARCAERALVLQAMGIEHEVRPLGGAWALSVPESRVDEATDQLDRYLRENRNWPRQQPAFPYHRIGGSGVAGYALVLSLIAAADFNRAFELDWFNAGRMHSGLVREGEWWRTLTSLTLHLDAEHLIANLLFGAGFGIIVGHLLGNGLAWFSILVAGAAGNALNALVQPANHTAAGASTAVFAALGLSAGYVWRRRRDLKGRWAIRWGPVIGAVVLLAYTGSGGERTDIIAHLTGFLAGIGLGTYYGGFKTGIDLAPRWQGLLGAAAVLLVAVAWAIALGAHGSLRG